MLLIQLKKVMKEMFRQIDVLSLDLLSTFVTRPYVFDLMSVDLKCVSICLQINICVSHLVANYLGV